MQHPNFMQRCNQMGLIYTYRTNSYKDDKIGYTSRVLQGKVFYIGTFEHRYKQISGNNSLFY